MCSSIAERLIANHELHRNEDLSIAMRERERMRLAPEPGGNAGGGRVTDRHTAPKLNGIAVDPTTTSIIEFAKTIIGDG